MKVASWNVNSLKVRLPQLLKWLENTQPDVVCLQETKLEDAFFPQSEIENAGYHVAYAGQKTYNGVALLVRKTHAAPTDITRENPYYPDPQKRLIAATVGSLRIVCAYVPNGQSVGSDKFHYKLDWLSALTRWIAEQLAKFPELALAGDFNIAPEDRDVHNPAAWEGQILCSPPEREAFKRLLALGLRDSFRLFDQQEKSFSWWDYRMLGFQKNLGMRIDLILLSDALARRCTATGIDRDMRKNERPSDHAPVTADISV